MPLPHRAFFVRLSVAISFLLMGTLASSAGCEDALAPGKALKTYQNAIKQLRDGLRPKAVKDFECMVSGDVDTMASSDGYYLLTYDFFSSDVFYDYLKKEMKSLKKNYNKNKKSALFAWTGGDFSEATLIAYEQTGEVRYLDLFVKYFEFVMKNRDDKRGQFDVYHDRIMKSWGESRKLKGPSSRTTEQVWVTHVTHAARIALAPTRFARLVAAEPDLLDYRPKADAFVTAVREALAEFEEDCVPFEGIDGCWYLRPMTDGPEATNHIHTLGRALINLAALDDDSSVRAEVDRIVDVFEQGVSAEDDGTVHWQYYPFFADQSVSANGLEYSERIWKASQTVPFIYRAYVEGYDVPQSLVDAIVESFLVHVIRDDEVIRNISPVESREVTASDKDGGRASRIVNWLKLSEIQPEIAERVRHLVASRPGLFENGWLGSTSRARGYAYFLGDQNPATTQVPSASDARRSETPQN